MITIKLGNLLKIELGEDRDSQMATPPSPALRKLNEAFGEVLRSLLDKGTDETTGDSA